ncbi:uncharacterized protein LOC142930456 [Petromyzon marinus]|uniref:uncharacterized protein LOC142930456 n=2 Tax=Petromyzon marinus TaxID=7757 RepID=UPI003F6F1E4B
MATVSGSRKLLKRRLAGPPLRRLSLKLNEWQEDWVTFFSRQRLQLQLDMIEKDYGERETRELWSRLQLRLGDFFRDVEVVPALLHGDLWTGNAAEINEGPVIFDPASFYGHLEYELAIAGMFQELYLHASLILPRSHPKVTRLRQEPEALATLPLPEPLESLWDRIPRVIHLHHAQSPQVNERCRKSWAMVYDYKNYYRP